MFAGTTTAAQYPLLLRHAAASAYPNKIRYRSHIVSNGWKG